MLRFWSGSRSHQNGTVGLHARADGIAVARVKRRKDERPRLTLCDYLETVSAGGERQLPEFARRHALTGARGVGIIDPGGYSLLQIELPEVPAAEMNEAVRWLIKDLLDYPLEETIIDHFQVPNQSRGRARLGYAVAARHSSVRQQADLLRAARLQVAAVDIPEMALHQLSIRLPEREQGVAFVYPGRHHTLITVSRNDTLFLSRALALGTDDFLTGAGGQGGEGGPAALDPRLQEMLGTVTLEIQRSLDFYESQYAQAPVAAIVIAPLEFSFPAFLPYFREYLGRRARLFDCGEIFELTPIPPEQQARCLLAIGAALRPEAARP